MLRLLLSIGLLLAFAGAQAACPPQCAVLSSVVHAAGVPHGLAKAVSDIEFDGAGLSASAGAAVAEVARQAKALPAKAVLRLRVQADAGLSDAAAAKQSRMRGQALRQALVNAGLPATALRISSR